MFPRSHTKATAVLLAATLLSVAAGAVAKEKKARHEKPQDSAAAAGGGQRIVVDGVREPSGIAVHPGLHRLFVVGDEGSVGELDETGRTVRADPVTGNLEDLAFHPPSGTLVLLVEDPPGLVVYDPAARRETRRLRLDTAGLLGRAPDARKAQGFEGLAFRPEAGRPGGGVFHLAHQRSPAMVVAVAFDPANATSVGGDAVVGRWPMEGYQRLSALYWDADRDRFLLIADGRLAVLGPDGATVARSGPLPMAQPEGVCLDESGALWIADDPSGLWRVPGGVSALASGTGRGPGGNP
jgi:uncharacterized protein YjiK